MYCRLLMVMKRLAINVLCYKYMCLLIACENLEVNAEQQQNLQSEMQNNSGSLSMQYIFWCVCITYLDVKSSKC